MKSKRVVAALERLVRERSLHKDWSYHGLDGAVASRALGKLGSCESVPVLVAAFRRVDPELKRVANPALAQYPLVWADFRAKMYILPALGELRCSEAKKFLLEYLAMDEARARELSAPQFEEATQALLCHRLTGSEIAALLRSPNPAVRGTAIEGASVPVNLEPASNGTNHRLQTQVYSNGEYQTGSSRSFDGVSAINGTADTITLSVHGFTDANWLSTDAMEQML